MSVCAKFQLPSLSRSSCIVYGGGWLGGLAVITVSNLHPSCLELELGLAFDNRKLESLLFCLINKAQTSVAFKHKRTYSLKFQLTHLSMSIAFHKFKFAKPFTVFSIIGCLCTVPGLLLLNLYNITGG